MVILLAMDKRVTTERANEVTILNFQDILRSLVEVLNRRGIFRTSWKWSNRPEVFRKKVFSSISQNCMPMPATLLKRDCGRILKNIYEQFLVLKHLICSFFSKMFNDWKFHFRRLKDIRITLWIASEIFQTSMF